MEIIPAWIRPGAIANYINDIYLVQLLQPKSSFPSQSQHQPTKFYGCGTIIILLVNHGVCLIRVNKLLQLSITQEPSLHRLLGLSLTHPKYVGMKSWNKTIVTVQKYITWKVGVISRQMWKV